MNKVVANADEAIRDVFDGATIMIGGFGLCGMPENLIRALVRKGTKESADDQQQRRRRRRGEWIAAGGGADCASHWNLRRREQVAGRDGAEGNDQARSGAAGNIFGADSRGGAGIPAFYTPTGVGTIVAEGKETREFDGRLYVMERGLKADFAFVKAWKGDREGNLIYRKTARNFNPMMATAAKITIAEVEHLVEVGELDGDAIHTPSIYVKRIFQGELYERRIERRTVRKA